MGTREGRGFFEKVVVVPWRGRWAPAGRSWSAPPVHTFESIYNKTTRQPGGSCGMWMWPWWLDLWKVQLPHALQLAHLMKVSACDRDWD